MRRILILAGCVLSAACGSSSPTTAPSPTPTPAVTRIISLGGNLSFGPVPLNTTATGLLTISNAGNSVLTVTGVSGPCAGSYKASFTSGSIQPGQTQNSTLQFTPTAVQDCSGSLTVASDATSGTSTISVKASGSLDGIPVFAKGGSGDTVFDLPSYITRLRITADYAGNSSNFIVKVGSALVVNELVGTFWNQTHFDGTYLVTSGTVQITNSSGVRWLFQEVR